MIPVKPAPTLKEPSKWSKEMIDFITRCLVKDTEDRATSAELLNHPWIKADVERYRVLKIGSPVLERLVKDNFDSIIKFRNAENAVERNPTSKSSISAMSQVELSLLRFYSLFNSSSSSSSYIFLRMQTIELLSGTMSQ